MPDQILSSLSSVTTIVVLLALLILLFVWLRYRGHVNAKHRTEMNEQVARLTKLLDANTEIQNRMKSATGGAVELNERFLRRIGAELHDGPAQSLGYALLRMQYILEQQPADDIKLEFHNVKQAVSSALVEIRSMSGGLVLPELEDMNFEEALMSAIERHNTITEIEIERYFVNLPEQVSMPLKICTYRFIQEGLNNAYRHGNAKKCHVHAKVENNVLYLSVKDDGRGFRVTKTQAGKTHLGLVGLKDRIVSMGGNFEIKSDLGVGTRVELSIALG